MKIGYAKFGDAGVGGGGEVRYIMGDVQVAYGENITVEWFFHTNRSKFSFFANFCKTLQR